MDSAVAELAQASHKQEATSISKRVQNDPTLSARLAALIANDDKLKQLETEFTRNTQDMHGVPYKVIKNVVVLVFVCKDGVLKKMDNNN